MDRCGLLAPVIGREPGEG